MCCGKPAPYKHPDYLRALARLVPASVCWICEEAGADSIDHVQPLSLGGTSDVWNLRPAHLRCNKSRGNR